MTNHDEKNQFNEREQFEMLAIDQLVPQDHFETNVAYRWFLGFGFYKEVPHFSTFGKNYKRRYHKSSVFEDKKIGNLDLARCLTLTLNRF